MGTTGVVVGVGAEYVSEVICSSIGVVDGIGRVGSGLMIWRGGIGLRLMIRGLFVEVVLF